MMEVSESVIADMFRTVGYALRDLRHAADEEGVDVAVARLVSVRHELRKLAPGACDLVPR